MYHTHLGVESLKPKSKQGVSTNTAKAAKVRRGFCWKINRSEGCKSDPCRWEHECKKCGGSHGFHECDSKK